MFENMKLGTKLVASFLLIATFGLVVGTISVLNMRQLNSYIDKLYTKDLLGVSYIKKAENARLDSGRRWRDAMLASTPEDKRKHAEFVEKNITEYKENMQKGGELLYTEKGKTILRELYDVTAEWEQLTQQMTTMIVEKNLTEITPEFREIHKKQNPLGKVIDGKIAELNQLKENEASKTIIESADLYLHSLILMIVLITLGFVASTVIGLMFSRYLARQLGGELSDAVTQVKNVSAGNLNTSIILQPRDNSSLLYSLKAMQSTINELILAQRVMAKKHDEGFISEKIDVSKFQGSYSEMASEINRLVQAHIAVKMHVVDVVSQYAKGDFSRDIDRLPQEKAKITVAIDSVKSALASMSKEIEMLSVAGAQGDFSKRSDTNQFQFMFKDMLNNLNDLMSTSEEAFGDVLRISSALAQGDLTQQIATQYPSGTFNDVKTALNGTVENLKALVGEIKDSTDTINTASQEIAAGNNDLSQRTEQQAASLEETAASMQELTSTVQANSENAKHANEMALASSEIARQGVAVVSQVVTTMEDINESSRKVVDIITVIDGIAFQTNILALNAAVEAARAGDQGRGFAVVASEVRSLAQRAASAAGEIKALISDSVDKVEDGTALVARAGKTMEEIVNSIQDVTATIGQITAASYEQTSGIEQVNQAIGQMDDVTQQNAALVEEAAASAEALEEQARNLSITMANFKIAGGQTKSSPAPVVKTSFSSNAAVSKAKPVTTHAIEAIDIDLDGALQKHVEWKVKLRSAISNKETLDAATISKDNCCDFGKWLHSEESHSKIAHLPSYQTCMSKHAEFHVAAGKVAEVINAKQYEQADKMLENGSDFVNSSSAVATAIMKLKKDTAAKPVTVAKAVKPKEPEVELFSDDWEEF